MKSVILSYDYELFFGDCSGTVEKTLIIPTNRLMACMEQCGYRGNFFVDWQMLKYLKKKNTERTISDYNLIEEQLKDMISRGHRVELHIHPHWVDAKYNGDGTWDFSDFTHYSLNSFPEEDIVKMFEEGVTLLTSIARDVDPNYNICAFRAGGWAVQPFDVLKNAFEKSGIYIDSSVMHGAYEKREGSFYDFRESPVTKKGYYHFEDDVCGIVNNGKFIEVPISCVKMGYTYRIIRRVYSILFGKVFCLTDGTHNRTANKASEKAKNSPNIISLTLSRVNPINVVINQYRCQSEISCYIDHPKDFSNITERSMKTLSLIRKRSIFYKTLISD